MNFLSRRPLLRVTRLLGVLLAAVSLWSSAGAAPPLQLSAEEAQFLEQHPVLRVSSEDDWPPFDFREDGQALGYSVDYLRLLAKRLGAQLQFEGGHSWQELLAMGQRRELDLVHVVAATPDRERYLRFTSPYLTLDSVLVTRNDTRPVLALEDLVGLRLAVVPDYWVNQAIGKRVPNLELISVSSPLDGLKAVATNRADAYADNLAVVTYLEQRYLLANLKVSSLPDLVDLRSEALRIGVRSDWPLLRSALEKAMATVTEEELLPLRRKWLGVMTPLPYERQRLALDPRQRAYLAGRGPLGFCVAEHEMPYLGLDDRGSYVGIVSDYSRLIALRLGKSIDILPLQADTEQRCDLRLFNDGTAVPDGFQSSAPLYRAPLVLVVNNNAMPVHGLSDLVGKRVSLVGAEGTAHDLLGSGFDVAAAQRGQTADEALVRLSNHQLDAVVAPLPVVLYHMQQLALGNVRVVAHSGYSVVHRLGVNRAEQPLLELVEMAVQSLSDDEHSRIARKWGPLDLPLVARDAEPLELSEAEVQWLADKPVLRVRIQDWPPFQLVRDGRYDGIAVEYLRLFARRFDLELSFVPRYLWPEAIKRVKTRDGFDVLPTVGRSPDREHDMNLTLDFLSYPFVTVARKGERGIGGFADLRDKTVAVEKGYLMHARLRDEHPQIRLKVVDETADALTAVAFGKADAYVGNMAVAAYLIADLGLANLQIVANTPFGNHDMAMATGAGWEPFVSLFNKFYRTLPEYIHQRIRRRWIPMTEVRNDTATWPGSLRLSEEEKAHLAAIGRIRFCVDPAWMPYEQIDAQGRHVGMAADYLKLLQQRLPVPLELQPTTSWEQTLEWARQGRCDILSLLNASPQRKTFLNFTAPYISAPIVMVTRSDVGYLAGLTALEGHSVAVVKGYIHEERIRRDYPGIKLMLVDSVADGMRRVSRGEIDAAVASLFVVVHVMQQEQLSNLKIAGHTEYTHELGIGVRKDDTTLLAVMDRAVRSLTPEEHNELRRKWTATRFEYGTDYTLVWEVAAAAALIIAVFLLWNRKLAVLNQRIRRQMAVIDTHVPTLEMDTDGRITAASEAFCQMTGYRREQLLGRLHEFLGGDELDQNRCADVRASLEQGGSWHGETRIVNAQGDSVWTDTLVSPRMHGNERVGYTVTRHDISDKKRIERLSTIDELTGLYNRRHFNNTFMSTREQVQRERQYFGFVIMDVDRFKRYNDHYGHIKGDQALAAVGRLLLEHMRRSGDLAFRLGGEEFGCLISADSADGVMEMAERLRAALQDLDIEHALNPPSGRLTLSAGVQILGPADELDKAGIYSQADEALYQAKADGRNRVVRAG